MNMKEESMSKHASSYRIWKFSYFVMFAEFWKTNFHVTNRNEKYIKYILWAYKVFLLALF